MKTLIKLIAGLVIFFGVLTLIKENKQKQIDESFSVVKPETDSQIQTNPIVEPTPVEETTEVSTEVSTETSMDVVHIKGLGDVNLEMLEKASKIVTQFYGYPCVIDENIEIPNDLYVSEGVSVDGGKVVDNLDNGQKTLFITSKSIFFENGELRGITNRYGKTVLVRGDESFLRETIIHEFGHTLGLSHCDDKSCIMAINNDIYDSGNFCQKCSQFLQTNVNVNK